MSTSDVPTPVTYVPRKRSPLVFFYGIVICLIAIGVAAVGWKVLFPTPPPPTVDDLKFPVAVIFDEKECRLHYDAKDLEVMGLMRVMAYDSVPYLVDNELNLFHLENLKSTKSSFGIFLSMGNGSTPVTFTLKNVRDKSHSKARTLLSKVRNYSLTEEEEAITKKLIQSSATLNETLPLAHRLRVE